MDEQLRILLRQANRTNLPEDRSKFEAAFGRIYREIAWDETCRIIDALAERVRPAGEYRTKEPDKGWGKLFGYGLEGHIYYGLGAYFDGGDPYHAASFHFMWETAPGWAVSSTPIIMKSRISHIELVNLVLYYSCDMSTHTYLLMPAWYHAGTTMVVDEIMHPAIADAMPDKLHIHPKDLA